MFDKMRGKRPKPQDVFVPGAPPLGAENVYTSRRQAESDLSTTLEENGIPVIWGDYGVGKTTLVQRHLLDEHLDDNLLYITSVSGLEMQDVFKAILEHLGYEIRTSRSRAITADGRMEINAYFAKGQAGEEEQNNETHELVVKAPTDLSINRIINERQLTIVLDEMHTASDELRADLSAWMKSTRTQMSPTKCSIVVVGTSGDASSLVALDEGLNRHLAEIKVDLLTSEEAGYIIDEGMNRLNLTIKSDLRRRLIAIAAGAPVLIQRLCLDASRNAMSNSRNQIAEEDIKHSIQRYLSFHGRRLYELYSKAVETTGAKRYRKQILRAVAEAPNEFATMEEIKAGVSKFLGEAVPAESLSGPLRDLRLEKYGTILKDVERADGERVYNYTRFSDPMMKAFVRFVHEVEEVLEDHPAVEA